MHTMLQNVLQRFEKNLYHCMEVGGQHHKQKPFVSSR